MEKRGYLNHPILIIKGFYQTIKIIKNTDARTKQKKQRYNGIFNTNKKLCWNWIEHIDRTDRHRLVKQITKCNINLKEGETLDDLEKKTEGCLLKNETDY